MALSCLTASAQFGAPRENPKVPSVTANVTEDFKPATSNQDNKQYPMVNSQRMVRAQIKAPDAKFVGLDIAGKIYEMTKDENGVWTGTSEPQDEGFHYYQLNIDGASVPDPNSLYFYGASRWGSGIDIPAADEAFYTVKNVPQGSVSEVYYWSTVQEKMRHGYIYLPNEYYPRRSSPCSICNTVWARTRRAGQLRARQASLWTTSLLRARLCRSSSSWITVSTRVAPATPIQPRCVGRASAVSARRVVLVASVLAVVVASAISSKPSSRFC